MSINTSWETAAVHILCSAAHTIAQIQVLGNGLVIKTIGSNHQYFAVINASIGGIRLLYLFTFCRNQSFHTLVMIHVAMGYYDGLEFCVSIYVFFELLPCVYGRC